MSKRQLLFISFIGFSVFVIGCGKDNVPPPEPQTGGVPVLNTGKPVAGNPSPSTAGVGPYYGNPAFTIPASFTSGGKDISSMTTRMLYNMGLLSEMMDWTLLHSRPLPSRPGVVDIILTFDDGPHTQILGGGRNYTENILYILKTNHIRKGIKAAFFVQTHVPSRGRNRIGLQLMAHMAAEGHIIGIHTGSTEDHVGHRLRSNLRPYDCNTDGEIDWKDGENALESDMIRAKERILNNIGVRPYFVRPTYGRYNNKVIRAYARQGLKRIMWDIDSNDSFRREDSMEVIGEEFRANLAKRIRAGSRRIIILFHDINWRTQMELERYLEIIDKTVREHNMTPHFPQNPFELHRMLLWKAAK